MRSVSVAPYLQGPLAMEDHADKATALARLREEAAVAHRETPGFAFGEGSAAARLVIVGEAPGEEEARAGRPFVGRSGKLLEQALAAAALSRGEVWITNVVKHRPTRLEGGRLANRAPTAAEVAADAAWLQRELEILQPAVILCLGNLAANSLIHKDFKITRERGQWFAGPLGARIMATYHPSYVLRGIGPDRTQREEEMRRDVAEAARAAHSG